MTPRVLIIYATTDGHTKKICSCIADILLEKNNQVEIVAIADATESQLIATDKIVVGASIRYGKHSKQVYDFVDRYQKIITSKPNAFFSVNVVARKQNKNTVETNPYLKKFLNEVSWEPDKVAVFAGKIDYPKYKFFDRLMIRLIMWMTKGPTDTKGTFEFTNWKKVAKFARDVHLM